MKRWLAFLFAALLLSVGGSVAVAQDDEATVAVAESEELGQYLTDAEGMTLYFFTNDTEEGVSTCYDDCEQAWPIFTAEEPLTLPEGVEGELTLIERTDGTTQVAYNGIPLYYWQGDQAPGDTTGQGVGDVWFVVAPGQEFGAAAAPMASPEASPEASPMASTTVLVATSDELGEYLTDAEGNTLYLFTNDTEPGVSVCEGGCLENWPLFTAEEPLTLPEGVEGELTMAEAADGSPMVAYNGIPLYYFAGDEAPGDTNGQEAGGVWFVVAPGTQHGETQPIEE
jgi:predicted lipoprotein with Yx(FWY)xxD motif